MTECSICGKKVGEIAFPMHVQWHIEDAEAKEDDR